MVSEKCKEEIVIKWKGKKIKYVDPTKLILNRSCIVFNRNHSLKAIDILNTLKGYIFNYGFAAYSDLAIMTNNQTNWKDTTIGWKDLSDAKVVTDGNREWICLPKPEDLDNV